MLHYVYIFETKLLIYFFNFSRVQCQKKTFVVLDSISPNIFMSQKDRPLSSLFYPLYQILFGDKIAGKMKYGNARADRWQENENGA